MKLSDKKILLISPEPWDHLFVSKHHYAIHLARRGNQVFFLNPPKKNESLKISDSIYENLKVIDYNGFVPGLQFLPLPVQRFFIRQKFMQLEQLIGSDIDIIWSFDNSVFYDFDALPDRVLKISHIVDLNQNFQFAKAAKTADFCFYNSTYIGEKVRSYSSRSFFINHGYAEAKNQEDVQLAPANFSVRAGYAGNLDIGYIDWLLMKDVIREHPQVGFYFAGSCKDQERLAFFNQSSNVSYLGSLKTAQLASFYQQMDLLLIVYLADQYRAQLANPHKMMEYLASGKPTVATYTAEYADLREGLIYMPERNADFPEVFRQVIINLTNGSDGPEHERKAFAKENTYDKQIERIEKIIYGLDKIENGSQFST